jgi:hypothetical protein
MTIASRVEECMLLARMVVPGLVLMTSAPSFAQAELKFPVRLGEGFELVVVKESFGSPRIHVRKRTLRTRLERASFVDRVRIDRSARSVTLELETSCNISYTETWTYDRLGALLENASAFGLHQKKNHKEAALGFARAAALDPTWNTPAYYLASAETLLGDQDAAIKALAHWLAEEPIGTYVRVSTDRELAPLLARPELQAIRAKEPGTVTLTADGITGKVAVTADGALLAVVREEYNWGSSAFESELDIYDVASGLRLAATPFVNYRESNNDCYPKHGSSENCRLTKAGRTTVARRAAALQTMLRELGFVPAAVEPGTVLESNGRHGKQRVAFRKNKLGLVHHYGPARVLQRDTELGAGAIAYAMDDAVFVEQPRVVVVWSSNSGAEDGCDSGKGSAVDLIHVKMP